MNSFSRLLSRSFHSSIAVASRSTVVSGRGKGDPLISGRLTRVKQNDSQSIFTETVRLNKAIVSLLEHKIHTEFPLLAQYAEPYDESSSLYSPERAKDGLLVSWRSFGEVYPGCDLQEGNLSQRLCQAVIKIDDLASYLELKCSSFPADKALKLAKLIAGNDYEESSNEIRIECSHFLRREDNQQWVRDTINRMINVVTDPESYKELDLESVPNQNNSLNIRKRLEFPSEWKRPDIVAQSEANAAL